MFSFDPQSAESRENFVQMYSGGPLTSRVGDFLFSQGVNVVPIYGGTECQFSFLDSCPKRILRFLSPVGAPSLVKRRKAEIDAGEWAWLQFSSRANVRWEPQGDGTFECQFLVRFYSFKVVSCLMVNFRLDCSRDAPGCC